MRTNRKPYLHQLERNSISKTLRVPLPPRLSDMASSFQKINLLQLTETSNNLKFLHYPHSVSLISLNKRKPSYSSLSSDSPTPPLSKQEAINQAKSSLSSTLAKPLNNPSFSVKKLKKVKQPRLRVEIPVIDDSPESLTQLALEVFENLSPRKKGSLAKILIFWPNSELADAGKRGFSNSSDLIKHVDISSVGEIRVLGSADVAVFMAPKDSFLDVMKEVTDSFYPRPVVIFNPEWSFEEESGFGELSGFVGSFDVVYSFMGSEVRGIFNKRSGVVSKCVQDGILSGEKWNIFVEENGKLKLVTKFNSRPSITEVENVLYNLMAVNSPLTKSTKFLKDLVSNVTGRK